MTPENHESPTPEPAPETPPTVPASPDSERSALLTWLACGACIVIFIGLAQAPKLDTWDELAKWGYYSPAAIWNGKYWAFITSVFVHLQFWHVAFNIYWLWILGSALERAIGSWRWLVFFVLAAIASSGAQFAVSGTTGIGASGVVYAMFGFMWVARPQYESFRRLLPQQTVVIFVAWLVLCVVATLLRVWEVGNAAHIAGLLFGAGVAALFVLRYRVALVTAGLAALLSVALVPLFWSPWSADWWSTKAYQAHRRQDYATAITYYRKSLEHGADPAWLVWNNLALCYLATGDQAKFQDALNELRRQNPEKAQELETELQKGP